RLRLTTTLSPPSCRRRRAGARQQNLARPVLPHITRRKKGRSGKLVLHVADRFIISGSNLSRLPRSASHSCVLLARTNRIAERSCSRAGPCLYSRLWCPVWPCGRQAALSGTIRTVGQLAIGLLRARNESVQGFRQATQLVLLARPIFVSPQYAKKPSLEAPIKGK